MLSRRSSARKPKSFDMGTYIRIYRKLEKEINQTWKKLCIDVKRKSPAAITRDKNRLMLLLGECNYMAREFVRCKYFD
jgi:hypothetical protein